MAACAGVREGRRAGSRPASAMSAHASLPHTHPCRAANLMKDGNVVGWSVRSRRWAEPELVQQQRRRPVAGEGRGSMGAPGAAAQRGRPLSCRRLPSLLKEATVMWPASARPVASCACRLPWPQTAATRPPRSPCVAPPRLLLPSTTPPASPPSLPCPLRPQNGYKDGRWNQWGTVSDWTEAKHATKKLAGCGMHGALPGTKQCTTAFCSGGCCWLSACLPACVPACLPAATAAPASALRRRRRCFGLAPPPPPPPLSVPLPPPLDLHPPLGPTALCRC